MNPLGRLWPLIVWMVLVVGVVAVCAWRASRARRHLYLFILPTLLLVACFNHYPILSAFHKSFCRYDLGGEPIFVGLRNFRNLFSDEPLAMGVRNLLKLIAFALAFRLWMPLLASIRVRCRMDQQTANLSSCNRNRWCSSRRR